MSTSPTTRSGALGSGPVPAVLRRGRQVALSVPLALAIVIAFAVVLRGVVWLSYDPVFQNNADTAPYLDMAAGAQFSDPVRSTGYPLFMDAVHAISADVDITILLQHLVGIATGVLMYLIVRRAGAPVWAAVVAAAAVLLSLDQVVLEHTLLSEFLFTFLLVAALYAAVGALGDPRDLAGRLTTRHLWLVAAGALFGLSVWTRSVSAPLIPLFALFFVFAIPGGRWQRIGRGALAGGSATAVVLVYFALNSAATGTFGLAQAGGWALYSRAAPFADCAQFTPPQHTEVLCQSVPASRRPGPDYYTWRSQSPARREFGYPPAADSTLRAFGARAILAQPRAYVTAVGRDFLRNFFPAINDDQFLGGVDYDYLDIQRRDHAIERDIARRMSFYYDPDDQNVDREALNTLSDVQSVLRVQPLLMLQAAILAGFGIWLGSGRVRWTLVLLLGTSLLLLLVPSAIGTYNARYSIPVGGPLIAAGAIGLWLCIGRLRGTGAPAGGSRPASGEASA